MEGHCSWSSRRDFRASAVQSATIQPVSRELKGNPPWGGGRGGRVKALIYFQKSAQFALER